MRPTVPPQITDAKEPLQPVAALLAFLFPGAGHFYLGHRRRGLCIAGGVLLLFLTGLLVGGIDSIDRRENALWFWFYGQMWNGPIAFAADYAHQSSFKVVGPVYGLRSARPDEYRHPVDGSAIPTRLDAATGTPVATITDPRTLASTDISPAYPPKVRSLGRIGELGTLFVAIAGMLNLVCIIDATFKHRRATP